MTDGDALLAAVLAAPDDDAPRLIYADWLEEKGDAWQAEFIRNQIRGIEPGIRPEFHRRGQTVGYTDAWGQFIATGYVNAAGEDVLFNMDDPHEYGNRRRDWYGNDLPPAPAE